MGIYLNSISAYSLYKRETEKPYFVDKSLFLSELMDTVKSGNHYICITRPRRFGKTVMANMIGAFFSDACESGDIFGNLKVSQELIYHQYKNQYKVIQISFNQMPKNCNSYEKYIERIEKKLVLDLKQEYPQLFFDEEDALWDMFHLIYEQVSGQQFVFVFDEWDYIFHRDFVTEKDKRAYIEFLSNLLKDKPYVAFAYMTGILPIAKYSSGSELNMFMEYTMATKEKFGEQFGFVDEEVDLLYEKYKERESNPMISRADLKEWYDGYQTFSGKRIYNPRSVVCSLNDNQISNYWTSSGPYDEIFYYIEHNVEDVRDDLARMVAGESVSAKVQEYAAISMKLNTRDEIFSAMVVYGFLSYSEGYVSIPNKELWSQFSIMIQKQPSLDYVYRLANASKRMLQATLQGDVKKVVEIMEYAHNTEIPLLNYNNETDLAAIVNLVYLSARDYYRVEREDKAGIGYVDFIFYPKKLEQDAFIVELKVDKSADDAIKQIIDRKYALKFEGKLGEKKRYTGRILAVGINYDKKTKVHECEIRVLRDKDSVAG